VVLGERGASIHPFSRVPPSSFEGAARRPYESGRHSVTELTQALLHSVVQCRGWPHRESWRNSRDMIPRRVRGTAQCGFVFDPGACKCQNIKCSGRGSRCGGGEPARASSEAESRPRGRPTLERGGTSREEATSSRARRNLTRGGNWPLSEAEPHPRGRPALERGGVLSVRRCAPRAKRSSARGWLSRMFWWAAGATRAVVPCHWAVIIFSVF
jgi:hypothetical protein